MSIMNIIHGQKNSKNAKQLERHLKGVSNHNRINILYVVAKFPAITVNSIAEKLSSNIKTTSDHTRKLVSAGLLNKNYNGNTVEHNISPFGKKILDFLTDF